MRYVLAILALAASGVLLLLGIGQRTFLAGPAEIAYPVTTGATTHYAVIDGAELHAVPGQANLVLRGDDAFVAIAKTRDIEGWVAPFAHDLVHVDAAAERTELLNVPAATPVSELLETDDDGEPVLLDPRGSDLWLETASGNGGTRVPVALTENQSVLIAGVDGGPIPDGTTLVWVQDNATPWAGPLFVAGGIFAFGGALLYLIAFDRDKRAVGPRRGRRGPFIGVQNVMQGGKKRRSKAVETAPLKGALSDQADHFYDEQPTEAPAAEAGGSTGSASADGGSAGDEVAGASSAHDASAHDGSAEEPHTKGGEDHA